MRSDEFPTWALSPDLARQALQHVVDHWSKAHGIETLEIPSPVPKSIARGKEFQFQKHLSRSLRTRQLAAARGDQAENLFEMVQTQVLPERVLAAAIVQRALQDFCRNWHSPCKLDQTLAISAYWWMFDLPILMPPTLTQAQRDVVIRGNVRHLRAKNSPAYWTPSECVEGALQFDVSELTNSKRSSVDYFPWGTSVRVRRWRYLTSFRYHCETVGVSAEALRERLILLPPTWGFQHE